MPATVISQRQSTNLYLNSVAYSLATSYTIPANQISLIFGFPYQILAGVVLTISSNSLLRINP